MDSYSSFKEYPLRLSVLDQTLCNSCNYFLPKTTKSSPRTAKSLLSKTAKSSRAIIICVFKFFKVLVHYLYCYLTSFSCHFPSSGIVLQINILYMYPRHFEHFLSGTITECTLVPFQNLILQVKSL